MTLKTAREALEKEPDPESAQEALRKKSRPLRVELGISRPTFLRTDGKARRAEAGVARGALGRVERAVKGG